MGLKDGSSPRLRGTGEFSGNAQVGYRFIPAPAGNSCLPLLSPPDRPVHPRACGEQGWCWSAAPARVGSSPRLRGTVVALGRLRVFCRFIPAPAGNRFGNLQSHGLPPVHPRACGEQSNADAERTTPPGSSPRLRGTEKHNTQKQVDSRFIPAPAGNRVGMTRSGLVVRFIPAPAGNSLGRGGGPAATPVHPRACGEQMPGTRVVDGIPGSSPRLRGTGGQL